MSKQIDYSKGIYDARQLGAGRMFILGVQHMFAMFGATVLVPLLTGLSVSTTLLCAGLGTLLFHLHHQKEGSRPSWAPPSPTWAVSPSWPPCWSDADGNLTVANTQMLPYACAGRCLLRPGVSGGQPADLHLRHPPHHAVLPARWSPAPSSSAIGLILAPSAINNCQANWLLAFAGAGSWSLSATSGARAWSRSCPS